jgi:hypothetical protein
LVNPDGIEPCGHTNCRLKVCRKAIETCQPRL